MENITMNLIPSTCGHFFLNWPVNKSLGDEIYCVNCERMYKLSKSDDK